MKISTSTETPQDAEVGPSRPADEQANPKASRESLGSKSHAFGIEGTVVKWNQKQCENCLRAKSFSFFILGRSIGGHATERVAVKE